MLDRTEEDGGLSKEEKERRRVLATDLEASLLQEEISWRHKSRVRWLKEGDKYTKFFHQMANANRKNNSIESLIVNDSPTSDPTIISEHIVSFCLYKNKVLVSVRIVCSKVCISARSIHKELCSCKNNFFYLNISYFNLVPQLVVQI